MIDNAEYTLDNHSMASIIETEVPQWRKAPHTLVLDLLCKEQEPRVRPVSLWQNAAQPGFVKGVPASQARETYELSKLWCSVCSFFKRLQVKQDAPQCLIGGAASHPLSSFM